MIETLLDTNGVIHLLEGKSDILAVRIMQSRPGAIALSSIGVHELYFGVYKSAKVAANLEFLRLGINDFPILEFDREDARMAGEIRAVLAKAGRPTGPYDVLLAGQAKARNLRFVTNNLKEFERVEGLRVEDWTV